ncbi:hypothetical protein ACFSWE_09590 [Leucobacter albus]|uniref:Phage protein D n=1 Tax=Leucobacter albus TaxID=272210 RepID=A0ABW3TRQ4_9MICO
MRYLAQRPSGEFVHTDIPLVDASPTWELSGPGGLDGYLAPDVGEAIAWDGHPVIDEWGTIIHLEQDGLIRGSWDVERVDYVGARLKVECRGVAGYPAGLVARVDWSLIQVDPAQVFRDLWAHVQSYQDGNRRVTVVGETPVRIGTDERTVDFTTGAGEHVSFTAGPYRISEADATDVGRELDSLAADTPFDFTTHSSWNADQSDVLHEIRIHYPKAGRRRHDLDFIQGDNITSVVPLEGSGDVWASEVLGIGAGEGKLALRRSMGKVSHRLRRTRVVEAKDVKSAARLDRIIADEYASIAPAPGVDSIRVRDHPNAPIGAWQLGDEILIQTVQPHLGDYQGWHRIVAWTWLPEGGAEIEVRRV